VFNGTGGQLENSPLECFFDLAKAEAWIAEHRLSGASPAAKIITIMRTGSAAREHGEVFNQYPYFYLSTPIPPRSPTTAASLTIRR
jgi:hypothetical protein